MGNKNSTEVEIKLDKPAYNPGQTISAVIFINAPKQHLCSKIVLHIEGYEESEFRNQVGNKELVNSQNVILRSFFVLKDFKSRKSYLEGQYEYPCEFTLPWTIPGSFNQKKGNYKATILYQLKVILVSPNSANNNYEKIKEIIIRQPPKQIDDYQMNKIDIHPQCFCFRNLGVCNVKCWFQKKNYLPNDDCAVICEIDNTRSKRDINRVRCEFKRTIKLRSTNGVKKEIKEVLNTVEFQGAKKGMGIIGPLAQKISLPLKYKNTKIGVLPSTTGHLVRCEYSIDVTPEVGGCFTKGNKTFKVNLQILHPDLVQEIQQPQVWQPEVHLKSKFEIVEKNETQMRKSVIFDADLEKFAAD